MRTDKLVEIDDYLMQRVQTIGEVNKNGVVMPKTDSNTVFSKHKNVKSVKLEDFKVLKVIGRGSFGKVNLVEYLPTHETYAMKSLKKDLLIEQEQIENTLLEKESYAVWFFVSKLKKEYILYCHFYRGVNYFSI